MNKQSDRRCQPRLLAAVLALLVLATACETMPTQVEAEPDPAPEPEVVEAPPAPAPPPPATLQQAVDFLDLGEIAAAEDVLERILDTSPASRIARRFLDQIRSDPLESMGTDYQEVQVQPGESLSVIAHRELGDSLQFFALARYNDIAVPRRLAPGMIVRIPDRLRSEPAAMPAVDIEWEDSPAEVEEADVAAAVETQEELVNQRRAGVLYAEGLNERQAGNLYLALSRFEEAIGLDPALASAAEAARATRNELVARLHELAVSQYRDQQIDDAIASWEEALQLDPAFEPARVNLDRARAVQQRLRELD